MLSEICEMQDMGKFSSKTGCQCRKRFCFYLTTNGLPLNDILGVIKNHPKIHVLQTVAQASILSENLFSTFLNS